MDVHRCRFVPYPSFAINALAFSHPSAKSAKPPPNLRLAIGRANGDLEIWNPLKGAWYQESIFRGGRDRSIEGLVWTQDPEDVDKRGFKVPGKLRLFSIGYSTTVTEWDLSLGRPVRHSSGNYGEIWCMAAQPKVPISKRVASKPDDESNEDQRQSLAVGCADGSVVILSAADGDLRYTKTMARPSKKGARVLSLTFQDRHTIIAGHADSTIRIYDMRNGQQIRNMTLGAGPKGGPKEILVWSVKCLTNGTIVSGDSTGTVNLWDAKTHSLSQRLHNHEADILDIAVSMDDQSIFSGGMDRRTVLYRQTGEKGRWAKISHSRLHDNDVKVLATYENKRMSVLASGGLDTQPVVMPVQEFGREHHRALSSLPQSPPLLSAPKQRLVATWWNRDINIWKVSRKRRHSLEIERRPDQSEQNGRRLVAKVVLQGEESITSVDMTSDGSLLVVSTMSEVKMFRLEPKDGVIRVKKMDIHLNIGRSGAKIVKFASDQRWLCLIRQNNDVQLHRLHNADDNRKGPRILERVVRLKRPMMQPVVMNYLNGSLGNYDRSINRVAFSADGRILAVTDLAGYLDTWVLEGHEDLTQEEDEDATKDTGSSSGDSDDEEDDSQVTSIFGERWIRNPAASLLPKLPSAPLLLAFRPSTIRDTKGLTNGITPVHPTRHNPHPQSHDLPHGEDRLLVLTAENQIIEFNVLEGRLSDWARRNPKSRIPREFQDLRDRPKGVIWDMRNGNERIWLYGVNWLWMFDLSRDLTVIDEESSDKNSKDHAIAIVNGNGQVKRKRDTEDSQDARKSEPRGRDTGAGSKVPDNELSMGIGRKIRKIQGTDAGNEQTLHLDHEPEPDTDDEDNFVFANGASSSSKQRRRMQEKGHHDEEDSQREIQVGDSNNDRRIVTSQGNDRLHYWCTYKYRPILGVVPLEDETVDAALDGDGEGDVVPRGVEVALVERPLWDMDLPPRYHGNQEWNP